MKSKNEKKASKILSEKMNIPERNITFSGMDTGKGESISTPLKITHKKFKKIKDLSEKEHTAICKRQKECSECTLKYEQLCAIKRLKSIKNSIDIHLEKEVEL